MARLILTLALCWIAFVGVVEAKFTQIKAGVECQSSDTSLGKFPNVEGCAAAVSNKGGKFFIYGTGAKAGKCFVEHTSSKKCSEGFEDDKYNFYQNDDASTPAFVKVKGGVECKSDDTDVGKFDKVEECAAAVSNKGGKFFVYGTGAKAGKCFIEHTSSKKCSEGFEDDKYNFYSLQSKNGMEQAQEGGKVAQQAAHAKAELAKAMASGDKEDIAKAEKALDKVEVKKPAAAMAQEAAAALADEMLGANKEERQFKEKEKKDMTFRKGLFRMGMRFQGLLHQLSNTDDKEVAQELKQELAKLKAKLPKDVVKAGNKELEQVRMLDTN